MRIGRADVSGPLRQEAVAWLMHGWVLVLTLVNLILADAIVWFVVAMGYGEEHSV